MIIFKKSRLKPAFFVYTKKQLLTLQRKLKKLNRGEDAELKKSVEPHDIYIEIRVALAEFVFI